MQLERPASFRYLEEAARTTRSFEDVDLREVQRILTVSTLQTVGQELVDSFGTELCRGFAVYVGDIAGRDIEIGDNKVAKRAAEWSVSTIQALEKEEFDTSHKIPLKNLKANRKLRHAGNL
jgi:hypothetical protein